jgi:hypothetical protein
MRDAINDALLPLIANPFMWNSAISKAGADWFNEQCEKINSAIEQVRPLLDKDVYIALVDHAKMCEKSVRKAFDSMHIGSDITKLPFALHEISDDARDQLFDDYMHFSCQLFDIPALYRILDDPHSLVVIYCGGAHADKLVQYLHDGGALCTSCDTMATDALVKNNQELYKVISLFVSDVLEVYGDVSGDGFGKTISWLDWLYIPFSWIWTDQNHQANTYNTKHADMPFVHHAAAIGDERMVAYLKDKDHADITVRNGTGQSIFDVAQSQNNLKIAELYNQGRA